METETFYRTGDCWIDLGTVALWENLISLGGKLRKKRDFLELKQGKGHTRLYPHKLVLSGEQGVIEEKLEKVSELVKKKLRGEDGWNGTTKFFFKQYNFNPDLAFRTPTRMEGMSSIRKGSCDYCGRQETKIRAAGTSENPLIVTKNKMSSFYPYLRRGSMMCLNCTFVSRLAHLRTLFRFRGSILNMFVIEANNLKDLADLIRGKFGQCYIQGEEYRNFNNVIPRTEGVSEEFLGFLLNLWNKLGRSDILSESFYKEFPSKFHIIQAERVSQRTVLLKKHLLFSNIQNILRIFQLMEKTTKTHRKYNVLQPVLKNMYYQRLGDIDTIIREEFSRKIIRGEEVYPVIEKFLYKSALVESQTLKSWMSYNLNSFITIYEKEVIGMDEGTIKSCRSVGRSLGSLASEKEKGILYTLRSTRNLDDFLGSLHQILTRYMDETSIYRKAMDNVLSEIDERNWKRYRALIGIYAVLSYMRERSKRR
ncbi:MAG: hypothetical protein ACOC6G_03970 [Thermoproteota archaeon]